jgi:ABC-2 type transport system ATP-binding protein
MIEAKGLSKLYGSFRALDKVSFEVRKGEVVGFLGPNGAGKSTTMRILTCYLSASAGNVKVHGLDVFDEPLAVRQKIGYLPQRAQMYGEMSVIEYLRFVAELRGIESSTFNKRMRNIVDICGLNQVLGKDIRTLSHGYRQRVGLGQALIHDPPILILDEPTADLDPNEKTEVIEYIKEIGQDRTVVLSTHNLAEVEAACGRAIIIAKGRVVADGSIDDVRARGGRVRYTLVVDETSHLNRSNGSVSVSADPGGAPKVREIQEWLTKIEGATDIKELPTDERTHAFSLLGPKNEDLRGEIYRLCVDQGWILLEMSRSVQKLEDVFKSLTKGDDRLAHGRKAAKEDLDDDDHLDDDEAGDDDDGDDDELDEDEDGDGDAGDDDAADDDAADDDAADDDAADDDAGGAAGDSDDGDDADEPADDDDADDDDDDEDDEDEDEDEDEDDDDDADEADDDEDKG